MCLSCQQLPELFLRHYRTQQCETFQLKIFYVPRVGTKHLSKSHEWYLLCSLLSYSATADRFFQHHTPCSAGLVHLGSSALPALGHCSFEQGFPRKSGFAAMLKVHLPMSPMSERRKKMIRMHKGTP